jgi:hypothetical protein
MGDRRQGTHEDEIVRACTCEWAECAEFHDRLVTLEQRGVEGVVWLLEVLAAYAEEEPSAAHPLAWTELVRCVAEHNWQNPLAVARLAAEVEALFRCRHDLSLLGERGGLPSWAMEA